MGHTVGGLRVSLGHGEVWIGVLVWCYMECNSRSVKMLFRRHWNAAGALVSPKGITHHSKEL